MARPARPERSRSALPLRQLSRFCYLINSDMVFGTHTNEYQAIEDAERESLRSSPPQNVYFLPQCPNLCLERCPRPQQIDNRPTNQPEKIPHHTTASPDSRSTASQMRFATRTAAPAL